MEKIKIAVIGVGHLGTYHAKNIMEIEHFQLMGLFDLNLEKCQKLANELGVRCYNNLEECLAEVDAVSIASTTSSHFAVADNAFRNNCHVFIEKPITPSLDEAYKLVEIADKSNKILQVGHIERFNPAMIAIKNIELNPLFVESHRLAPFQPRGTDVAVVLDLMIHDIDLILNLVKSPVKNIDAAGVNIISDSEDISNCRLVFENGCIANVTASRISMKKMRKMRIFQPGAYLGLDFNDGTAEIFYLPDEFADAAALQPHSFPLGKLQWENREINISSSIIKPENINPLKEELSHFADCILSGKKPLVDGHEAVRALEVAQQILAEIKKHKEYVLGKR